MDIYMNVYALLWKYSDTRTQKSPAAMAGSLFVSTLLVDRGHGLLLDVMSC